MRHYRGKRRSIRPTIRSAKYIVVQAPTSEAPGLQAVIIAVGTDNATLGQTSVIDVAIPTGARIESFEIFMPKINLSATANIITWTIQRTLSGQTVVNPLLAGGNPIRKNIILTGVLGLGDHQNNSLHIKFRVPKRFQRIGDGDQWNLVTDNLVAVTTSYYIIYKIIM